MKGIITRNGAKPTDIKYWLDFNIQRYVTRFTTNTVEKNKDLWSLYAHTWKLAYSNILKILQTQNEHFQMKNSGSFYTFAQNIDRWYLLEPPRRGGSNVYPQIMFLSRNKKTNVYHVNPSFTV